jgi:cation transporter-like permease
MPPKLAPGKAILDIEQTVAGIPRERHIMRIIRESIGILIIASAISTAGGLGIEAISRKLVAILPLLVLMPALNDMVGDFGSIVSSRFTEMLFLRHISERNWWRSPELRKLIRAIFTVAVIAAAYLGLLSYGLAMLQGYPFEPLRLLQVVAAALAVTLVIVTVLSSAAIAGGFWVYRRGHNPDNYLIPLTTALGDMASMAALAAVVGLGF